MARGTCSGEKAAPRVAQAAVRGGRPEPSFGKPEPSVGKILEMPPCFQGPRGPAESLMSPFNIIKGSLVAPESSWPYAPSHTFRMHQNPESFENYPNHFGIIVESHLNHSLQEATKGAVLNPILHSWSAALGWLHTEPHGFCWDTKPRTRHQRCTKVTRKVRGT